MAWMLVVAAALALSQSAPVASKPDFSGKWTMDRSRSQSETPDGTRLTIKQTATEISIETAEGSNNTWTRTYPIEASPKPTDPGAASAGSRAYWDGVKLITEAVGNISGQTVSTKETRWLNPAGTEMTVESLIVVQHGYQTQGSRNYGAATSVYVRAKAP